MTVAAVAVLPPCAASPARAVSPPPIDDTRLPQPAPPKPPQPTVQREMCAVTSMDHRADTNEPFGFDLQQVWRMTRGSGQRVAVLDTGVAPNPRLAHLSAGGDYVSVGDGTQDCDGHGTAVAGIIAAATASTDDFRGVAPDATIISIRQSSSKFGPANGSATTGFGDVDTMARAVRTAADMGASVINISSVACARADPALDDRSLGAALSYAVDRKNVVVVAAAGNAGQCPAPESGATVVVSPAWYDDLVLTVGSVNSRGEPSDFTLAGPWVDVAAPGEGVLSLSSSGEGLANAIGGKRHSTPLTGTSYAAPVVSGLAALVRSRFPTWTARQVMQRIKATAHHPPGGRDERVGAGVVDVFAAASSDSPTDPIAPTAHAPVPIRVPALPTPPDHRPRQAAFWGAAVCAMVLAMMLSMRPLATRLRQSTARNILRDRGIGPAEVRAGRQPAQHRPRRCDNSIR
jgi:membrane-anchored mycosin MYCP